VVEKGSPGWRRWLPPARHVLRDGRFGNLDSPLDELAVDARRAPRVGGGDPPDERANFGIDSETPTFGPAAPSPVPAEICPVPPDDRGWLDDDQLLRDVLLGLLARTAIEGNAGGCRQHHMATVRWVLAHRRSAFQGWDAAAGGSILIGGAFVLTGGPAVWTA
jgi:hypothetical protein